MIGNRNRNGAADKILLHDDMTATLTNFFESMLK